MGSTLRTEAKDQSIAYLERCVGTAYIRSAPPLWTYAAKWFNPRTGEWSEAGTVEVNLSGRIQVPAPPSDDDWALSLVVAGQNREESGDVMKSLSALAVREGEPRGRASIATRLTPSLLRRRPPMSRARFPSHWQPSFDPVGGPIYSKPHPRVVSDTGSKSFSRHFGFAWTPAPPSGKTTVRGGFAIFLATSGTGGMYAYGLSQATPFVATLDSCLAPNATQSNTFLGEILDPVDASKGPNPFRSQQLASDICTFPATFSSLWPDPIDTLDAAVVRDIPVKEPLSMQLRFEVFDAPSRVQVSGPFLSLISAALGKTTSTAKSARTL